MAEDRTPDALSTDLIRNADRRMTIAEIALAAGVTKPTVSKVLNNRDDVSDETRERVQQVIKERGYQRNRAARVLKNGRSGLIDFVDPDLDGEMLAQILHGVEAALEHTGMRLVMMTTHTSIREERQWVEQILDKSSDGALIALPHDPKNVKRLAEHRVPFVMIDDRHALPFEVPTVSISNWTSGFTTTQYLLSLGHRRIATITGTFSYLSAKARLAGYRDALEDAGVVVSSEYIRQGDFSHHTATQIGYEQAEALLRLPLPPTAIIAANDWQAVGVYDAIHAHGLSIPGDISVVGFDNTTPATLLRPKLTTIHRPLFEMGKIATDMLLRLIEGKPLDALRVELATSLIVRESTTAPEDHLSGAAGGEENS